MELRAETETSIGKKVAELVFFYETERPGHALAEGTEVRNEIARRVIENFKLASSMKEFLHQVLLVLYDYRNHQWAYGACKDEKRRLQLADRIVRIF